MKKRVLMSSVAASVLAGMFVLSGCGSSSSTVAATPGDSVTEPEQTVKKTVVEEKKPDLDTRSCSQLTYVGSVHGVQVQGLDAAGEVFATVSTDENGQYCFSQKPTEVKIVAGSGVDSDLDKAVSCSSNAMNFEEVTPCFTIAGFNEDTSPLHSLNRAKQFRSFMGDVYEKMDIDFDVYDAAILDALTKSSIVEIQDVLSAVKVKADKEGHGVDSNLTAAQKEIIENIVDISTSTASEDTVSLAMYSFNSSAAKAKKDYDGNATKQALSEGDDGVTKWINEYRLLIEKYINANTPEDEKNRSETVVAVEKAGINLKIFASYLVAQIDGGELKDKNGDDVDLDTAATALANLGKAIPAASLGDKYLKTTYIDCGPLAELITVEADYNKTRISFGNISNINCSSGCDTVYANYLDGNKSKAVTELVMQTKGIQFNEEGLKLTIPAQYDHINEYAGNLFNLNLAFDINSSGIVESESPLLATVVIDLPNSCSGDDAKDEYIAMTFTVVPTGFDNAGNGTFVIPEASNVVFSSKIKSINLVGDANVTTYPKMLASSPLALADRESFVVKNGVMNLNLIDLLDQIIVKAGTSVGDIKDLVVRAVSNVDGDPSMMKTSISLIDISKASSDVAADIKASNFITNASTIDPSAYRLDLSGVSTYDLIFDNMRKEDAAVKTVAIKTCFTGSDD